MKKLLLLTFLFTVYVSMQAVTITNSSFSPSIDGAIKTVKVTPRPGARPLFEEFIQEFRLGEYPDNKIAVNIPQHQSATISFKTPGRPLESFSVIVKTRDNDTEIDIK